ncbi:unnamed protein product [Sphagnum troendelagicum]
MASSVVEQQQQLLSEEAGCKKIRKPYTITKSRESWTEQEHDKFLEALQLFDRDWKKIEAFVGSKTVIQIRSHAQKYFLKVQKNGTGERVPPPRPKRKSAQPYPQKAPKNGICAFLVECTSFCCVGLHVLYRQNNSSCSKSLVKNVVFRQIIQQPIQVNLYGEHNTLLAGGLHSRSSLSGSSPAGWSQHMLARNHVAQDSCIRATPDFSEVYKFIGSVFDPGVSGHLRTLKEMSPIDRETVLLLMRNLSINLSSPDFKEDGTVDDDKSVSAQAGTPVPLTPVLSPRSVESDHSQQRASILQPYTDSATGSIQPLQLHSYDGGGPISPTFTGHGVSSSSPQGLEPASLVLSPSVAMQMHTEAMARLDQKPNTVVYVLGSPNLTTGVVEEGAAGVDTWWT